VIWEEAAASEDYYRRVKSFIDDLCGRIIDTAERCDDGQATAETLEALRQELWEHSAPVGLNWDITATLKGDAAYWVRRYEDRSQSASEQASLNAKEVWDGYAQRLFQADLLRDIFGPLPFQPVPIPDAVLAWDNGCVVKLAASIYAERDFSQERMGVLADALEEAGADTVLIEHLRGSGPQHVRGCHVVDLLTGRQ
jgi:hypothetical protein